MNRSEGEDHYFMNPELITLLDRFVAAHEKLADGMTRIADELHYKDQDYIAPSFASELSYKIGQVATALEKISEALPTPPEE